MQMLSEDNINEPRSFIVKLLERDMPTDEVQQQELQQPEQQSYLMLTVPFSKSVNVQFVPRSIQGVIESHWNRVMHMLNVVLNSTSEWYTLERTECARLYIMEDKTKTPKEVIKAAEQLFMSGIEMYQSNMQQQHSYSSSPKSQRQSCHRRSKYSQYNPEEVMRSVRLLIDLNFAETLFAAYSHVVRHHVEMFLHILCCAQSYLHNGFTRSNTNYSISHNVYVLFVLTTFWKQFRSALNEIATVCVFLNRWYICHYAGKKSLEEVGVNCLTQLLTSPHRSVLAKRKKYKRLNGNVTGTKSNVDSKSLYSHQYHIDLDVDKTNSDNTNVNEMEKKEDDENEILHKQEFCTLLPLAYSGFGELIEYELSSDAHVQELQHIFTTETVNRNRTDVHYFVRELLSTSVFGNCWWRQQDSNSNNKVNSVEKINNSTNIIIGSEDEQSDDNMFYTPRSQRSVSSAIPTKTTTTSYSPECKHGYVKTREVNSVTNTVEQVEWKMHNINGDDDDDNVNNSQERHNATSQYAKEAMYTLFQEFVSLCTAMDVYSETFMPSLQYTIEQYYTKITNACEEHFNEQCVSASVYFDYVHHTLDAWKTRTFAYLHHNSLPTIEEQIQKLLLDDRARAILKRDFAPCMQRMNYKTLSLAERLLSESTYIRDRQCVLNLFKNYVEEVGKEIMQTLGHNKSDILINNNDALQTKNKSIHSVLLKILCNGTNSAHSQETWESSVANQIITKWNVEFATVLSMLELLETMNDMINRAFVHAKRDYSVKLNEALEIVLQVHSQEFALQLACFANAIMISITKSHEEQPTEQSPVTRTQNTLYKECESQNVKRKVKTSTLKCNSTPSPTILAETGANSRKRSRLSLECDKEVDEKSSELQDDDNENEEEMASSNDSVISNTSKTNIEAVHNDFLQQISVLFAHTPDKLYFISVYEYQLAQRLLSLLYNVDSKGPSEWIELKEQEEEQLMVEWELECKRHAILEQEKYFIDLIREICGASFTSRLDGMCKDFASAITLSSEESSNCNNNVDGANRNSDTYNCDTHKKKKINSRVYLLTSSYWPSSFQPAKSTSVKDNVQYTSTEVDDNQTHSDNVNSMMEKSVIHPLGSNNNKASQPKNSNLPVRITESEANNELPPTTSSTKKNASVLHLPTSEWQSLLSDTENEFYASHDKRRIQWQHELSTATFTGQFVVLDSCVGDNLRNETNSGNDGAFSFVEYTFHGSVLQCAILLTIDQHTRSNNNNSNPHQKTNNGITFATLCSLLGVSESASEIDSAVLSMLSEPYQLINLLVKTDDSESLLGKKENNVNKLTSPIVHLQKSLHTLNDEHDNTKEEREQLKELRATSRLAINEHFYSPTHEVYLPMSSTTVKLLHSNMLHTSEEPHEATAHTSSLSHEDSKNENVTNATISKNKDDLYDSRKTKIDTEALLHKQVIEAWIVTYMKCNNTCQHHILFDFVKGKVKFNLSSTLFKSAIDWCVERGYLERIHASTSTSITSDKGINEINIDNETYKYLS